MSEEYNERLSVDLMAIKIRIKEFMADHPELERASFSGSNGTRSEELGPRAYADVHPVELDLDEIEACNYLSDTSVFPAYSTSVERLYASWYAGGITKFVIHEVVGLTSERLEQWAKLDGPAGERARALIAERGQ